HAQPVRYPGPPGWAIFESFHAGAVAGPRVLALRPPGEQLQPQRCLLRLLRHGARLSRLQVDISPAGDRSAARNRRPRLSDPQLRDRPRTYLRRAPLPLHRTAVPRGRRLVHAVASHRGRELSEMDGAWPTTTLRDRLCLTPRGSNLDRRLCVGCSFKNMMVLAQGVEP